MSNRLFLRRAVRNAFVAGALVSAGAYAGTANAQQQAPGADAVEEIVVTGSRLRRSRDFIEVSPVQTIDFEQIQTSGDLTLEEVVNSFPQLGPETSSTSNHTGGAGALTANLRSLGSTRTLVLVDGRRFIPADETGVVDMATIPSMLVQNIEIVTGGASSVYGSDAIAGAVNFTLRDAFEGVEVAYQFGETTRGDGASHKIDMLFGTSSADGRGNLMLHGSYTERDSVFVGDRGFAAQPLIPGSDGTFQEFGVSSIPEGFVALNSAQRAEIVGVDFDAAEAACPGPVQGLRFEEGGVPAPFCQPTDQYNYAAPNFLLRPLDRWQISALGSYDVADDIEAYAQMFYVKKQNEFQQAPLNIQPTTPGQETGTILIPNADTNPLFEQPLRDFFAANRDFFDPEGDGIFAVRGTARRFEEFGPRNVSFDSDAMNFTTGLRGDFDVGSRNWAWDTFFQWGRADTVQTNVGLLSRTRLDAGFELVEEDGVVRCERDFLDCQPVNIFGPGSLSPEAADYLSSSTTTRRRFTRAVSGASITGDAFDLPAGAVPVALGVEWRREGYQIRPDDPAMSGDLGQTPAMPIDGNYNIFEVFGETRLPLLSDLPAIQGLSIELAARYADYSTIGSVLAWNTSLDWEVNDQFRMRAGYGKAIRAPNLTELFSPVSAGFRGGVDPCWASSEPTAAQRELCIQQGVPENFIDDLSPGPAVGFNVETGGNINLDEEEATTTTIGAVFTPERLPSLMVSADYYRIKVEDAIAEVSPQALINSCFDTLDPNSVACQSITRLSSGLVDRLRAPLLNVAQREVDGLDVQVQYALDSVPHWLALPGRSADTTLDFMLVNSWQFENSSTPFEGGTKVDCAGYYDGTCSSGTIRITPDHRALLRANWRSGPLRISPEMRFIGNMKLSPDSAPNERGTIGSWVYWDVTAGYDVTDSLTLFGGVTNLFDKTPPVMGYRAGGDTNTEPQLYDVLGRRYFVGASVRFGGD